MGVAPTGRELTNRAIVIHRISGGKIAEEWGMGTIGLKLRKQRLEQEIRERERVEQELRVARTIQQASLPKEVRVLEKSKRSFKMGRSPRERRRLLQRTSWNSSFFQALG
jgi:hypothetical protein